MTSKKCCLLWFRKHVISNMLEIHNKDSLTSITTFNNNNTRLFKHLPHIINYYKKLSLYEETLIGSALSVNRNNRLNAETKIHQAESRVDSV